MLSKILNSIFGKSRVEEDVNQYIQPKEIKENNGDLAYRDSIPKGEHVEDFDKNLKNLIIIDDNFGMINFLKNDIEILISEHKIEKCNIFTFSNSSAAFELETFMRENPNILFSFGIIDITFGGRRTQNDGHNIVYTGVDVVSMLYKQNKNIKYMLLTGNNLNPAIRSNRKLIKKFNDVNNSDILDVTVFKTSVDMNSRRDEILKRLFNE